MSEKFKKDLAVLNVKKFSLTQNIKTLNKLSFELSNDSCDVCEFEVRFEELRPDYESLNKCYSDIFKILINQGLDDDLVAEQTEMDVMNNVYYSTLANHRKYVKLTQPSNGAVSTRQMPTHAAQVRLPQIDLPQFNGKLKEWPHFKDLFVSLVHDNEFLPDIEKFHYLVTSLKSEPLSLVKTLPLTSQNYKIVWDQLVARYDNKRLLAAHYFDEILNSKVVTKESPKHLRQLIDLCTENVTALKAMNFPVDCGDYMLCHIFLLRLDPHTRQLFERKYSDVEFPSFEQLVAFLKDHCKSLEACQLFSSDTITSLETGKATLITKFPKKQDKFAFVPAATNTYLTNGYEQPQCIFCNETHAIYRCPKFIALPCSQKRTFIQSKSACFNCLSTGHSSKSCKSQSTCKKCSKAHHTMLHESFSNVLPAHGHYTEKLDSQKQCNATLSSENCNPPNTALTASPVSAIDKQSTVLLGTTAIQIMDSDGEYKTYRALVDPGSQVSFITENCAQELSLVRSKYTAPITGISQSVVDSPRGIVRTYIKPRFSKLPCLQTNAIILKCITSPLPSSQICQDVKNYFKNFELADPFFDVPGKIDFLIGADLFSEVFVGKQRKTPQNYPTAYSSIFGWILLGKTVTNCVPHTSVSHLTVTQAHSLETSLKIFWEIEEPPVKTHSSHEDLQAEEQFKQSHSRDENGRYVVKLPFKELPDLGDSHSFAYQSFTRLEKRLSCDDTLRGQYNDFMNEYLSLGHMQKCDPNVNPKYFIPHHGVFKIKADSTPQLRVVFNASAKTTNGKSLNDQLLKGPKLQNDICTILFNFRLHPVVFSADICKMYRQINVHPDHQTYQAILWRDSPNLPLDSYLLNTVTYGVSSAPFLAIRTLHQLAIDEGKQYPSASQSLLNDIYVDDLLVGGQSLEECVSLKSDLINLLKLGGFELKKWASNNSALLFDIPETNQEVTFTRNDLETSAIKVLGIKWDPKSDNFMYEVNIKSFMNTKRGVLSVLSSVYDPLGWITPTILVAKKLMQSIWTAGIDWDSPLTETLLNEWNLFVRDLPQLKNVTIPRLVLPESYVSLQLHGFCDASSVGYGACVYLRSISSAGNIDVKLVVAKSKVAPLKTISIPKLELCATVLLAKLLHFYKNFLASKLKNNFLDVFAWTDSMIALCWIRSSPHLLKTFVANRVAIVQELVEPSSWHHVQGSENPADCSSRGVLPSDLLNHNLWWSGSNWLCLDCKFWPVQEIPNTPFDSLPETKPAVSSNLTTNDNESSNFILERFSSLTRLQRVTAWCRRFITNCRSSIDQRITGPLSTTELKESLIIWIKWTQKYEFAEELKLLKNEKPCKPELQRLDPFVDQDGILRVGGRLRHSLLGYNSRHPILLSKNGYLTTLLIDHFHLIYFHSGPRNLQCLLQRNYWILSARNAIRKRTLQCVKCCKLKCKPVQPFMADLPAFRTNPCRPFLKVGVDYGGPFKMKSDKSRKPQIKKSYLCLFVCMTTKALHLEVVSELTTEAFLAAFDRLIARRGICIDVYSDQGTTFVGADAVLQEVNKFWKDPQNSSKILSCLANKGITWHFNPPSAPHFGGIWEAGIKSAKFHLYHVIGDQVLTFEEITTLFVQIEAILNSRPLCELSSDPNEIEVLTPGHFLIGEPLVGVPQPDFTPLPQNRLSRWQLINQIKQHFWKRWSEEYLNTLQQRSKWFLKQENLKPGDIVVLKDSRFTPMTWLLGRIDSTTPGSDGIVRVVKVKTKTGVYSRPAASLIKLPI